MLSATADTLARARPRRNLSPIISRHRRVLRQVGRSIRLDDIGMGDRRCLKSLQDAVVQRGADGHLASLFRPGEPIVRPPPQPARLHE